MIVAIIFLIISVGLVILEKNIPKKNKYDTYDMYYIGIIGIIFSVLTIGANISKNNNKMHLNNMTMYILVEWPESQYFMGVEGCYYINPMENSNLDQAMFVPEEIFNAVMNYETSNTRTSN